MRGRTRPQWWRQKDVTDSAGQSICGGGEAGGELGGGATDLCRLDSREVPVANLAVITARDDATGVDGETVN